MIVCARSSEEERMGDSHEVVGSNPIGRSTGEKHERRYVYIHRTRA